MHYQYTTQNTYIAFFYYTWNIYDDLLYLRSKYEEKVSKNIAVIIYLIFIINCNKFLKLF